MMAAKLKGWFRGRYADDAFRYSLVAVLLLTAVAVSLVFSVKWKFGVALFGFVVLLVMNLFSLRLGLLLVFFAVPFDRLGKLGPESVLTWAKGFIGVLILAWTVHLLIKRDPRPLAVLVRSPLLRLAILLMVFSFFSVINAVDYDVFVGQNVRRISSLLLFILIVTIADREVQVRQLLYVFLFAYFFVGLTVMYEIATGQSILQTVWGEKDTGLEYTLTSGEFRVGGPGGDPDFLAISVIFPLLVSTSLLFDRIPRLAKAAIAVVMMLLLISLLATGSRGGLGALLLGAGILWVFTRMRYKYLIAVFAGALGVMTVAALAVAGTASVKRYTGEAGGKSLKFRFGWTQMALLMIQDHPIVGVGTGNFVRQYNRYTRAVPEVPRKKYWTHNSFLQTWAENGVFAFLTYAALYLTAAIAMLRVICTTRDPDLRRLAVLLLSSVAAYFFFAGTSNVLENENYWIVFALVTVVSALAREVSSRSGPTPEGRAA